MTRGRSSRRGPGDRGASLRLAGVGAGPACGEPPAESFRSCVTIRKHPDRAGWSQLEIYNALGALVREIGLPGLIVSQAEIDAAYAWLHEHNCRPLRLV